MKTISRSARNATRSELVAATEKMNREMMAIMNLASIRPLTKLEEHRYHALQLEIDEIERSLPFR